MSEKHRPMKLKRRECLALGLGVAAAYGAQQWNWLVGNAREERQPTDVDKTINELWRMEAAVIDWEKVNETLVPELARTLLGQRGKGLGTGQESLQILRYWDRDWQVGRVEVDTADELERALNPTLFARSGLANRGLLMTDGKGSGNQPAFKGENDIYFVQETSALNDVHVEALYELMRVGLESQGERVDGSVYRKALARVAQAEGFRLRSRLFVVNLDLFNMYREKKLVYYDYHLEMQAGGKAPMALLTIKENFNAIELAGVPVGGWVGMRLVDKGVDPVQREMTRWLDQIGMMAYPRGPMSCWEKVTEREDELSGWDNEGWHKSA